MKVVQSVFIIIIIIIIIISYWMLNNVVYNLPDHCSFWQDKAGVFSGMFKKNTKPAEVSTIRSIHWWVSSGACMLL